MTEESLSGSGKHRHMSRYYGNGRNWETSPELFDALNAEFNFTLDPCATPATAKCSVFFTECDNGLAQDWSRHRVFMNPPYGREIYAWTRKAKEESKRGALVVGILPASTDLSWWHDDVMGHAEVRFIRRRIKFLVNGKPAWPFSPTVIVIWWPHNSTPAKL